VTPGALNLVTGPGSKVGNEIVTNPDVKAISFTGSEGTGSQIAIEAAKRRARVQLEMGGKNPTIVLADADLDEALSVVTNAAFFSTGQRCTATSRVLEYVGVGTGEGAKLLVGGERLSGGAHARGYFSSPAVMTDVTSSMRVAQEEIFGPVLGVLPADSLDHAIEIANGIRFGLSAGICTRSLSSAYEFINRIEAGLVMVNLPSAGVEYHVPFGGSKASSFGMREQGPVAVDFYSEIQTAYLKY
jgi:aldehyde dehydrogenase (NAD+)